MEPTIGIEPMNLFLTKEALYRLSYVGMCHMFEGFQLIRPTRRRSEHGAGDEARTRDIQLGRLKLYQLSYSRILTFFGFAVLRPRIHINHRRMRI